MAATDAPGSYQPLRPADARRYVAFALDVVEAFEADDPVGAGRILGRLYDDPAVDPWDLVQAIAAVAARRPAGRAGGSRAARAARRPRGRRR